MSAPQEIPVRWNITRTVAQDPQGNNIMLDAQVIVARKIEPGSRMWLGTLAEWVGTGTGSGASDEELHEVKTISETEDIKGRNIRRELGLMRLHNK